jgi:acyl-CoA thioester hydrolase
VSEPAVTASEGTRSAGGWPYTHVVEVRYGECDQQGIVFNAHYLAFVDDAMDHWMRSLSGSLPGGGDAADAANAWVGTWDVMLKTATLTWHGPARWGERLAIDCGVSRWGTTSFDVAFHLRVGARAVCDVGITYVSVSPADHVPMATPAEVVAAMGPIVEVPRRLDGG